MALDQRAAIARSELHVILLEYRGLALEPDGWAFDVSADVPPGLTSADMTELENRAAWGDR